MLIHIATVLCPQCHEPVKIWAESGEEVPRHRPPRCPDCHAGLYEEVVALQAK